MMQNTNTNPVINNLNTLWQSPERIWAKCPEHDYRIADLAKSVGEKLNKIQRHNVKICLIYRADRIEFVSDLLACAMANVTVVMPQNGQPKTLCDVAIASNADCGLGDVPNPLSTNCTSVSDLKSFNDITVIVFTSGSTGVPKPIGKPLSKYLLEAETLADKYSFDNTVFLSSVSHQHVYGLLFSVLLPLGFAQTIWRDDIHFEERLHYLTKQFTNCVFVASPAILTRLSENVSPSSLCYVFSSGGPLSTEQAKAVEDKLKAPCERIFGSSETGGIAFQTTQNDYWITLPHVAITVKNGLLVVDSAYAFETPYFSTDRVEILDNDRFRLLGRADDIVKIGEKRVALPALEQALIALPYILHARVVALPAPRNALGAVLVLDESGQKIHQKNRNQFYRNIKKGLNNQFEAVTQPKFFRVRPHLPENAQGKVLKSDLLALFN